MSLSDQPPAGPDGGSGTDATGQIELVSRTASLELSVIASDFRPVASGMGRLSATLPPGIYQLVARAGPVVDRKLIRLEAGAVYRDDAVAVAFPSVAPVRETSTSHEYQQVAAERASNAIAQLDGPPSGLVIVVRDVRGYEGPPLGAADLAPFGLLDQSLNPIDGFEGGWTIQANEAVATWSRRLAPGGYALRTDPAKAGDGPRRPTAIQAFDQSIWLSRDWQTIVFITTGQGGPRTSAASVHMTTVSLGWSPYEVDVGHALELAYLGLREGRSVLPDDLLGVLLGTKFVNPMLGVVAAHSLLLRHEPDMRLLEVVLKNLDGMMPGHPDVVALRWMAATRLAAAGGGGASAAGVPAGAATWPPMLLPSYRALIDMDAAYPSAIADGSPAERAAANLLVQGVWTSWMPLPPAAPDAALPTRRTRRGGPVGAGPGGPLGAGPGALPEAEAVTEVLPAVARDPSLIDKVPLTDPATARVAAYLGGLAALEGPSGRAERFATLSVQEIGLATTLPVATVNRALARIATAMAPPVAPPGGMRFLRGSLPILATGALLLAGVVGAVAWCAGSEGCPLGPAGPEPTPTLVAVTTPVVTTPVVATPVVATPPTQRTPNIKPTPLRPRVTPIFLELPPPLDFGKVLIDGDPQTRSLIFRAVEPVPIRFALGPTNDPAFSTGGGCDVTETPSGPFECLITFDPQREGPHVGALDVFLGREQVPRTIPLAGEGVSAGQIQ